MNDPYEILGVRPSASADEMKKAFRRLARECHPDSDLGNPWAEDEFKELSAAYDLLSDPKRRSQYDRGDLGDDWKRTRSSGGKSPKDPPKKPNKPAPGPTHKKNSKTAGLKIKGADVDYTLHVDFLDAVKGVERRISMATGNRLKVKIPSYTEDGKVLRLKGQGMKGIGGGGDGDAYVEILIDPHPLFSSDGYDVHVDVLVTLQEAVLGGKIEAPTIDGSVTMTVPKGSNTETQLRLKGKGLKKAGGRGDQFVHLQIVLPKKPDKDLIRFLQKWSPGHDYQVRPKPRVSARNTGAKKK